MDGLDSQNGYGWLDCMDLRDWIAGLDDFVSMVPFAWYDALPDLSHLTVSVEKKHSDRICRPDAVAMQYGVRRLKHIFALLLSFGQSGSPFCHNFLVVLKSPAAWNQFGLDWKAPDFGPGIV
ncbi:hypothetical protein Nepgr_018844 [Nepenthes gracilis]|uniref:Uncharacterized protein n=1 Tax=Nepenthes gracilis TaxID=150966 RepID=A0AAD3SSW4_NEPGR|nr:hypothetical protein Nepgr_018844 [Nepenthes gracilis]